MKDRMGNWLSGEHEIATFIRKGFLELFTTSNHYADLKEWQPPFWTSRLNMEDIAQLELPIINEEIFMTLQYLKPYKGPRPNGLHAGFFQRFWPTVGPSVKTEVKQIFSTGKISEYLNQTLITLIPKCNCPESLNNFRPIGLCNTVYKIITKLLVAPIRPALDYLVSPLQTAFVPKRKGVDNAIIVQELIHSMSKKKGREGFMGKYLGFPIKHTSLPQDFGAIVECVQNHFASWKTHFLSFARQVMLTQATLSTIPNYAMQWCEPPYQDNTEH